MSQRVILRTILLRPTSRQQIFLTFYTGDLHSWREPTFEIKGLFGRKDSPRFNLGGLPSSLSVTVIRVAFGRSHYDLVPVLESFISFALLTLLV